MGQLINGRWLTSKQLLNITPSLAKFENHSFNAIISQSENSLFPAEMGRYHLYISLACPWAHRTLIMHKLKQLDSIISVSVVEPKVNDRGWEFGTDGDPNNDYKFLYELYQKSHQNFTGRATLPVLWDKKQKTIVSNESQDIMRMFNSNFNDLSYNYDDYYPNHLKNSIDRINQKVHDHISSKLFPLISTDQSDTYRNIYQNFYLTLNWLEDHLESNRYLCGDTITEADWRLFTSIVRIDQIYANYFHYPSKKIGDFPILNRYLLSIYNYPGIKDTVNLHHADIHYRSIHSLNTPIHARSNNTSIAQAEPA